MSHELADAVLLRFCRVADCAVAKAVCSSPRQSSSEKALTRQSNNALSQDEGAHQAHGPLHLSAAREASLEVTRALAWVSAGSSSRADTLLVCERAILALVKWQSRSCTGSSEKGPHRSRALSATFLLFFDAVLAVLGNIDGLGGRLGVISPRAWAQMSAICWRMRLWQRLAGIGTSRRVQRRKAVTFPRADYCDLRSGRTKAGPTASVCSLSPPAFSPSPALALVMAHLASPRASTP